MESQFLFEQLYYLLSPSEQQAFERWLAAELNGRRPELLQFFRLWKSGVSPEQIAEALDLPAHRARKRLDHLRADVTERLEMFLAILALKEDSLLRDRMILQLIQRRKARGPFRLLFPKLHKRLLKQPTRDRQFYEHLYEHHSAHKAHLVDFPALLRNEASLTQERIEAATSVARLRLMRLILTATVQGEALPDHLEQALPWLFPTPTEGSPDPHRTDVERLMGRLYRAYREEIWKQEHPAISEIHLFEELKEIAPQIKPIQRGDLISMLFNLLARRTKFAPESRQKSVYQQLLRLTKWDQQINSQRVSRQKYRNTMMLYLNIADRSETAEEKHQLLEEAETFLTEKARMLPPEEQKSALEFNQAHFHFAKGTYEKVGFALTNEDLSDPYYNIGYQVIKCQAKYELGQRRELLPELLSLTQRIYKTPLLQLQDKQTYLNRVKLFTKIVRAKTSKRLLQLREEVSQTRPITGQDWLLKIIKERLFAEAG